MNAIQIDNTKEWRFKRWDVRSDGRVFWQYCKTSKNKEQWVTWEQALRYQESILKYAKARRSSKHGKEYQKAYKQKQKFKDYRRSYKNAHEKTKRLIDPMFAMSCRLRMRICDAIRRNGFHKTSKTKDMLGCSWEFFMSYMESKFVDGMTWKNRDKWHIDHIIPLASAKSQEELIKLNHYTNLQPLWAVDNLRKGCKTPI